MNFPERIAQHKSESDSFAIMLYKLRDLGIFRNVTDNDYGIDFEIELVEKDLNDGKDYVKGHCVKVQVKGSKNMSKVNVAPSVANIKQSSLNYWAELSYSMPVVAIAVDTNDEKLYITDDLFWQATSLLDNSDETKKIYFSRDADVSKVIKNYALGYSLRDLIASHKWFLRHIVALQYVIIYWTGNDTFMEVDDNQEAAIFYSSLENAQILLANDEQFLESLALNHMTAKQFFSLNYHHNKADREYGCFSYDYVFEMVNIYLPHVVRKIKELNKKVLDATYYWAHKDPSYLRDVLTTIIVEFSTMNDLEKQFELAIPGYHYGDAFREESGWNIYNSAVTEHFQKVCEHYACTANDLWTVYCKKMME